MHGKKSNIHIDSTNPIFRGLPLAIEAVRYHSLIAKRDTVPDELTIIAEDDIGEVMAVRHRSYAVYGLQFSSGIRFNAERQSDHAKFLESGEWHK